MEINAAEELKIQTIKVEPDAERATTTVVPPSATNDVSLESPLTTSLNETKSLLEHLPTDTTKRRVYNLSAVVCQITEGNQTHLVALVYVDGVYHRMKPDPVRSKSGQWYVFNDFNINPIQLDEAPWYTLEWKVPCVLFYTSTDMPVEPSEVQRDTIVNPFVQASGAYAKSFK